MKSRFKEYREACGMTQKEAAISLGVSVQAVSYWETDARIPSPEKLIQIADLYGVSVDELFGRTREPSAHVKNNRLRILRDSKRLTQQEVADAIGETKRTYASWERGERKIPNDMLVKFADFYGITLDDLMGRTSEPQDQPDERTELARRYDQLDDDEKRFVIEMIDMILKSK